MNEPLIPPRFDNDDDDDDDGHPTTDDSGSIIAGDKSAHFQKRGFIGARIDGDGELGAEEVSTRIARYGVVRLV